MFKNKKSHDRMFLFILLCTFILGVSPAFSGSKSYVHHEPRAEKIMFCTNLQSAIELLFSTKKNNVSVFKDKYKNLSKHCHVRNWSHISVETIFRSNSPPSETEFNFNLIRGIVADDADGTQYQVYILTQNPVPAPDMSGGSQ